ncbi:EAL domain-containing protein [Azospirillum sp. YIM B02556]|uniref:EAL domain-containing protein n=1 Tax=Azospirillum endophyticum TaxID=2800326 RepID=A0ABS1F248_9PROT|nr:EAL domain-containing protein [Azospirillum endophyticum]MBK1837492.1 EAL domain-containing protein [Azospirillum endophyticum]
MHQPLTAEFDRLPARKSMRGNALLDAIPVGIAILDHRLRCLRLNRRMAAMAGLPAAAAGLPFADVWPDAEDALLAAAPLALAGTVVEDIILSESERLLVATLHPYDDEEAAALLCIVEDRTGARRGEAELRQVKELHRHTLELSGLYPWCSTPDGTPHTTRRWRGRIGLGADDIATAQDWIAALHPDDRPPFRAAWTHALATGGALEIDLRLRIARHDDPVGDGHRWFRRRASARRDADGRILQWYGTDEDIHDRKMTEAALRESESFARQILDNSPECLKVLDMEGRVTFMNVPGVQLMELDSPNTLMGRPWEDIWPEERRPQLRAAIDAARRGDTARFLGFCPTAMGTPKWWDNLICPLPGPDGRPQRLLAISRDVTDIQHARQALEETTTLLSGVLESTTDAVVFIDQDWRITYRNPVAASVLEGRGIRLGDDFFGAFPQQTESCGLFRKAMADQTPAVFEEYVAALGIWTEVHAFPTAQGLSVFFRNVTERRRVEEERRAAQERIARLARLDSLTGLSNRLYFQERLEQTLRDAATDGEADGGAMAVHYIDLDQFKAVNDTLGHPAGDALLRQVADRLRGCAGTGDLVSRFGGDEFAILQTGLWGPAEAEDLARCIISAMAEPFDVDGAQIQTGTSIGIALSGRDGAEADALLKAADIALYRAKADGRNTHRFFAPEMAERLKAFHDLKLGLHEALRRGEFELHYQPLVGADNGYLRGFEALIRWRRPGRGLVGPADFIPVAEETGLIGPIGDWALREACREATGWPDGIAVSVNVSSVQFRGRGLVESVRQALADTGLAPGRLELEITESVLLQDDDTNLGTLRALRALGTRIVMDDFGTGYSALGYLCRFRFDKVKIDRSFVANLPRCDGSTAVVQAVAGMGRTLGVVITAEGVEEQAQFEAVRELGCQEAQGYLFSRPVPAAEVPALIARLREPAAG